MKTRICLLSLLLPELVSCTHLPESASTRYEYPESGLVRRNMVADSFRPLPAAPIYLRPDTFRKAAAVNLHSPQASWPSLARPRH